MASQTTSDVDTVLGKRKAQKNYVLRLTSSPEPTDYESTLISKPIIVNGELAEKSKKRYKCTVENCDKTYSKPSRLAEHERTHTGERPFTCDVCQKSYFRETHLQAHARIHLPHSARPFVCSEPNCNKRFWTDQHLRVHLEWHNGAKMFACTEGDCHESFAKQSQLRAHICALHAPAGTKPYRCDHDGCTKSFVTNQHLRAHKKTHDENRYACLQGDCLSASGPRYFSTWTALQDHIRADHPPSCTHPSCNGRIFSNLRNLKAHQKLHELRDLEDRVNTTLSDPEKPPSKKRRGGELGRDWKCSVDGCGKDFKSEKALTTHINVSHLGKRDFGCPKCGDKFGYKHLLQRHLVKKHKEETSENSSDESEEGKQDRMDIDTITGNAYAKRLSKLRCPYPDMPDDHMAQAGQGSGEGRRCNYGFMRAYDLMRHMRSKHGVDATC